MGRYGPAARPHPLTAQTPALQYGHAGHTGSRATIRPMGIYDEQRMADLADYLADDDCDDCDDCDGPDWIPGCDSIANHCETYPYN